MRIKRFFASAIRDAIRQVREEMGADAVILSNRQVDGGVEIVAAVDYDEDVLSGLRGGPDEAPRAAPVGREPPPAGPEDSAPPAPRQKILWTQDPALVAMRRELNAVRGLLEHQLSGFAWGDLARQRPRYTALLRFLLELELAPDLCRRIAVKVPDHLEAQDARRGALGRLAHQIPVAADAILDQGGVIALVGATGVGKTTTVAKLAARFALRHGAGEVALVTTDNYRIGAHQQLRTYAQVLDVPLRAAREPAELATVLAGLRDKRLVLIDTAGMGQRDVRLARQFKLIRSGAGPVRPLLVLAANTQAAAMAEAVDVCQQAGGLSGCVLTKVDEAASLGGALSVIIGRRLPVAYVGDGQRVPEDLHPARAHSLVSRAVTLARRRAARHHGRETGPGGEAGQDRMLDNMAMAMAFGEEAHRVRP